MSFWGTVYNVNRLSLLVSLGARLGNWARGGLYALRDHQNRPMATPVEQSRAERMLGELCTELHNDKDSYAPETALERLASPEIKQWYQINHKTYQRRQEALAKLSKEEQEALGIR